jgi:hypothetical protein
VLVDELDSSDWLEVLDEESVLSDDSVDVLDDD